MEAAAPVGGPLRPLRSTHPRQPSDALAGPAAAAATPTASPAAAPSSGPTSPPAASAPNADSAVPASPPTPRRPHRKVMSAAVSATIDRASATAALVEEAPVLPSEQADDAAWAAAAVVVTPVRAASLPQLVARLTAAAEPDLHLRVIVLATHSAYVPSLTLWQALLDRYHLPWYANGGPSTSNWSCIYLH